MPDSPGASEVGGGLDGLYLNLGDARKAISEKEAEERRKKLQNETWVGELGQTRLLNLLYMVKKHQGHLPNTGGLNMAKKFDAVKLELEKTDCFKGHPGMDGMSYKKKWERVRDDFIKKNAPEANNSGNAPPTETERLIAELLKEKEDREVCTHLYTFVHICTHLYSPSFPSFFTESRPGQEGQGSEAAGEAADPCLLPRYGANFEADLRWPVVQRLLPPPSSPVRRLCRTCTSLG